MARLFPERPDLAQLRRQAKELQRAAQAGDAEALARVGGVSDRLSLSAAQLAVAREYGFASWPRLKAEVDRRRHLETGDIQELTRLLAAEPELAEAPVLSCITAPGQTALTFVAMGRFSGRFDHRRAGELARVLLAAGAPVDGHPGDGESPLITAASYGDLEVARALIEAGADLEATGVAVPGGTALDHAIQCGWSEIVDLLAAAGAAVTTISRAAAVGDLAGFLTPQTSQLDRARALQAAAICQRLEVIDQLLGAGTPIDAEVDGATALHNAARLGKARSVAHLLARGADPNRLDSEYHSTPLGWCWHHHQGWGPAPGCAEVERLLEPVTHGDWVREETRAHRAEPTDAAAIAAALQAAFAEHRAHLTRTSYDDAVPDATGVATWLAEGPVWVAVRGHQVIGALAATPESSTLRLRGPAVIPARRGAGVGGLLISRATEWALPAGFDRLRVDLPPWLHGARRYLARNGFVVAEPSHDPHRTPPVTMLRDIRPLRQATR